MIKKEIKYNICSRCICDTSIPGITFNSNNECNFCSLHDKMENDFPTGEKGKKILEKIVKKIKKSGKDNKFDCVVGISGGRDSTYSLWYVIKVLGLRPLAVHFNDGFGNPIAGKNMSNACKILDVELRTITSDWRESKDIKLAFIKASTPDMEEGTDLGIATSLYSVANKENIKYLLIGQSFRTEAIAPLAWNYLDGKYLKAVHKKFGTVKLRKWKPNDPGFNLGIKEMFYYVIVKRIKTIPFLYYVDYIRDDVDVFLKENLKWEDPGAHYFDDLYQALMTNVHRTKFGINRRIYNYSAMIRSGQLDRNLAIERANRKYELEDPKIIDLCIKRLGLKKDEFESLINNEPKYFWDYPNSYNFIKKFKLIIKLLSKINILPGSAYDKYFNCGGPK